MKTEPVGDGDGSQTPFDKRRQLAPRTSEEEAVFIAQKYLEHRSILEAKLANTVNGGRFLRQNLLEVVAADVSSKFGVASRSRKYVEQKLRDMKKEARKYFCLQQSQANDERSGQNAQRAPPEHIRIMMDAMLSTQSTSSASGSWDVDAISGSSSVEPKFDADEGQSEEIDVLDCEENSSTSGSSYSNPTAAEPSASADPVSVSTSNPPELTIGQSLQQNPFASTAALIEACLDANTASLLRAAATSAAPLNRGVLNSFRPLSLLEGYAMPSTSTADPLPGLQPSSVHPAATNQHAAPAGLKSPARGSLAKKRHVPYVPLRSLRRRVLLEKLEAARAFTSMCTSVTQNISEMTRVVTDTYRQQAELLQLQFLTAKGFSN